jgi:hypothetical protein
MLLGKTLLRALTHLLSILDELNSFGVYRGAFEGQRDSFDFAVRSFPCKMVVGLVRGEPTNSYFSQFPQ